MRLRKALLAATFVLFFGAVVPVFAQSPDTRLPVRGTHPSGGASEPGSAAFLLYGLVSLYAARRRARSKAPKA